MDKTACLIILIVGFVINIFVALNSQEKSQDVKKAEIENKENAVNKERLSFIIKSTFSDNGTIFPKGEIKVANGENQRFMVIPNLGYDVATLIVDNVLVEKTKQYEFKNINAPHNIHVTFKPAKVLSVGLTESKTNEELIDILVARNHTIGIKQNGKVIILGDGANPLPQVPGRIEGVFPLEIYLGYLNALKEIESISPGKVLLKNIVWQYDFTDVIGVAINSRNPTALKIDGSIIKLRGGGNQMGPANLRGVIGISMIENGNLLTLMHDGTVRQWEYDSNRELPVPERLTNIKAIAGGYSHWIALKGDGTVVEWELKNKEINVIATLDIKDIIQVAASNYQTIGLKKDGTVVSWLFNNGPNYVNKYIEIPKGLPPVKKISASSGTILFLFQ